MSVPTQKPLAKQLIHEEAITQYAKLCASEFEAIDVDDSVLGQLNQMSLDSILGDVSELRMGQCCLSGIWLLYGRLDDSHDISQTIKTPEGSFWHGIMHRLERDFWNSKYWYRNVGQHPVIRQLQSEFGHVYPFEFVDLCEQLSEDQGAVNRNQELVAKISRLEWQLLFEHCYQNAIS